MRAGGTGIASLCFFVRRREADERDAQAIPITFQPPKREGKVNTMNIRKTLKSLFAGAVALAGLAAGAAPTVTVDKVESAEPWTQVKVDYTLGGLDADLEYKVAFDVTARGVTRGVTNAAAKLENRAYTEVIDTKALFGEAKADPKAKARVLLFAVKPQGGVQLWANGPYWAECNVGATKPEETGYYFWWGDTVGYKRNAANDGWVSSQDGTTTILFSPSDATAGQTFGKDNATLQSEGWIDASGNLTMAHDAARAHLGGTWRMPTDAEIQALIANTTTEWVTDYQGTGVAGRLVKGKDAYAEKSIFIPAAGNGYGSSLNYSGSDGYCWSSTPDAGYSGYAWDLRFVSSGFDRYGCSRYNGYSARAVRGFAE